MYRIWISILYDVWTGGPDATGSLYLGGCGFFLKNLSFRPLQKLFEKVSGKRRNPSRRTIVEVFGWDLRIWFISFSYTTLSLELFNWSVPPKKGGRSRASWAMKLGCLWGMGSAHFAGWCLCSGETQVTSWSCWYLASRHSDSSDWGAKQILQSNKKGVGAKSSWRGCYVFFSPVKTDQIGNVCSTSNSIYLSQADVPHKWMSLTNTTISRSWGVLSPHRPLLLLRVGFPEVQQQSRLLDIVT